MLGITIAAMAKARTHFICRSCGGVQAKWMGKCPDCGTWDALERYVEPKDTSHTRMLAGSWLATDAGGDQGDGGSVVVGSATAIATPLPEIETADFARIPTHIAELAKYDQELAYLGPDEYAQVMRDTFQAERRVVERLGLARTS